MSILSLQCCEVTVFVCVTTAGKVEALDVSIFLDQDPAKIFCGLLALGKS